MRPMAFALTAGFLVALLVLPTAARAQDAPPGERDLTIAGYDADAFRSDDHRSLFVSENLFYNNSGSEEFSGNITLWVQPDAYIATRLCGSVRNRIARVEDGQTLSCLNLTDEGGGTYTLPAFGAGHALSYYGEIHPLVLNVTLRNSTTSIPMAFNATIGPSEIVPATLTVGNLTLHADNTHLAAMASLTWGPPRNLTLAQPVEVANSGLRDELLDIAVLGIPAGWTARVQKDGRAVDSVWVPAGQRVALVLNVSAPSNIAHLFLEYIVPGQELPSGEVVVTLEKRFSHNTTYALLFLYALEDDVVTSAGGFETHGARVWDDTAQRYRWAIIGSDLPAGSAPTVTVRWVPPPFVIPPWAIAALAVLGAILVAYPVWQRRHRKGEAKTAEEAAPSMRPQAPPMTREELRARRDTLRKTLGRLREEEERSGIPEDLRSEIEGETRAELAEVERRLELYRAAEDRKRRVVAALRRLERDRKEGKVDRDVYESLKARYEREAVKAMRQIDEAKGIMPEEGRSDDAE